ADFESRSAQSEDEGWYPQMSEEINELSPTPRRLGVFRREQTANAVIEYHHAEIQKDEGKHETRRSHAEITNDCGRVIADRILPDSRIDANRDGQSICKN